MFVYIWKHNDTPFYVGLSKSQRRTNPLNSGGRGWLCKQTLEKVGRKNVVVELHIVDTLEEGQVLERSLIEKYGRIQLGNGTLTNLRKGGEGRKFITEQEKIALSKRMRENNPVHNPEVRAKITARMHDPDVKVKFAGDNNPAKRLEVREKIKAKWADPLYKEMMRQKKLGKKIHSGEEIERRRAYLLSEANPMKGYHKILNTDKTIREKRLKSLKSPEVRKKISERLKEAWARRKLNTV